MIDREDVRLLLSAFVLVILATGLIVWGAVMAVVVREIWLWAY